MVIKCGPVCGCIVVHEQIRVHWLLGTSLYCEIKYHRTMIRNRGKCGEVVDEEWLVTENKVQERRALTCGGETCWAACIVAIL